MKYLLPVWLVTFVFATTSLAQNKTDAVNAAKPKPAKTLKPFGIAPAGLTTPEVKHAVERFDAASVLPSKPKPFTRMRWTSEDPPKLWYIGLWGPNIDNDLIALTKSTPDLTMVALHEPHIDDDGMKSIAALPGLRYLHVNPIERWKKKGQPGPMYCFPEFASSPDRPRVTGKSLSYFEEKETLEGLYLLDAVIDSADLVHLAKLPRLSTLALPCEIDEAAMTHLPACRRLHRLTLGYREITGAEIKQLANWKKLQYLTITHATLSDEALAAIGELPALKSLEIVASELSDDQLSHLRLPDTLATLGLQQNNISGPGLIQLANHAQNLTTLGLEFNDLNNQSLPALQGFTNVERLYLSHCRGITKEGIGSGSLQKMEQLRELRLRDLKDVTDASVEALSKLTFLNKLSVRGTNVTWDGVDQLKKAMPETYIFK
ncbi:Leucine Rich repeats (2 copies) [Stieleria bergensis]|uniref:Leucine Rich repeats (2 copies) n=2 Tax=Stieleria bergensis TaxID=2528025 RepID=A0A517SW62_9BACT|nr:Leucine Rich repeats (2 copies) [Planctomycetes bacterium SV_7m_r]